MAPTSEPEGVTASVVAVCVFAVNRYSDGRNQG